MESKVMVLPLQNGTTFVTVPIIMNGERLHCVFFNGARGLSLVGIFDAKPRDVGPLWLYESYTRRVVPAEAIRNARERAIEALADLEPQTERMTSFDFAVDVAP